MTLKFETILQIFQKIIQLFKCSHHFEKHQQILSKNYLKKWPQNGPLSCYDSDILKFEAETTPLREPIAFVNQNMDLPISHLWYV